MSHLVRELGATLDRIVLLAPSESRLLKLSESLAEDLVTDFSSQPIQYRSVRLNSGPIHAWMAFNLGNRAGLDVRIQVLGASYFPKLPAISLLKRSEAIFLELPWGSKQADLLPQLDLPETPLENPIVVSGMKHIPEGEQDNLRAKAHLAWLQSRFKKLHFVEHSEHFFREGLEWVLSQ